MHVVSISDRIFLRPWFWGIYFVLFVSLFLFFFKTPSFSQLHSNSDKGDGSVRYLLSGEGAGTIFIINEVTGDIHAAKSLDREKKSHYVLHAQAINRHTNTALESESEFIIKVQDVNDNAPKFPDGPFAASVPEMADIGEAFGDSGITEESGGWCLVFLYWTRRAHMCFTRLCVLVRFLLWWSGGSFRGLYHGVVP